MTNEEAKFVLHVYRPNGADAADPALSAALDQAKQDPSLEKWFAAQQAFDRAMCAKLGSVRPPESLRAAILAGAKASRPRAKITWWRSPVPMALAASVALLIAVGIAFWPASASARAIAAFAINDTLFEAHEGEASESVGAWQTMLSESGRRLGEGMPLDFAKLRASGCRTIRFEGRDLLEVCFNRDGKWFHCYVGLASDFPRLAKEASAQFVDHQGASAAAWSDGRLVYVLASKAGQEAIRRLL